MTAEARSGSASATPTAGEDADIALPHDELWPRGGGWPAPQPGKTADAVRLGAPPWRTSISATGAHATPAAIRQALPRYSSALIGPPALDLSAALRIVDAGDVHEPDGDEGVERTVARVRELATDTRLVI